MGAYTTHLRGAAKIFPVDRVPERLEAVKKIPGLVSVDSTQGDVVGMIIKENGGMVDRSVDSVGYQAHGGKEVEGEVPNVVLEQCIMVTGPLGESVFLGSMS